MPPDLVDIAIVGAGAAGLMTAIWIGRTRTSPGTRIVLLDGSTKLGIKILVAGGGRCNVTHHHVDETHYAGGSRNTIRNILRRFSADDTVAFFNDIGVELKREPTGKLFPTTDRAQTVLEALLTETRRVGVEIVHPWRVDSIEQSSDGFTLRRADSNDTLNTSRLVLATGGKALPKSGSDGIGYSLAKSLGHTITPRVFPSLVALVTGPDSHWLNKLSGISLRAGVEVRAGTNKRLARFDNDLLITHFGLSGPAIMDASRHLTHARATDPDAHLAISWLPDEPFESIDAALRDLGPKRISTWLRTKLPERLADALLDHLSTDPATTGANLSKDTRRALAHALTAMRIDITRDRGFAHAEATAGGIPLNEIDPSTMRSRKRDNLWLVGELLDVDGRIGGFNFQWAWSTGHIAGTSIGHDLST
ncbi:MAG: BaiN/RdsA family NAD(P)/FAD-dependent oxidoreductase [Planctomycetota bacterium]|jgi:predicted Rossmann fold flavoprotein